jgi:hypothetical protein
VADLVFHECAHVWRRQVLTADDPEEEWAAGEAAADALVREWERAAAVLHANELVAEETDEGNHG